MERAEEATCRAALAELTVELTLLDTLLQVTIAGIGVLRKVSHRDHDVKEAMPVIEAMEQEAVRDTTRYRAEVALARNDYAPALEHDLDFIRRVQHLVRTYKLLHQYLQNCAEMVSEALKDSVKEAPEVVEPKPRLRLVQGGRA